MATSYPQSLKDIIIIIKRKIQGCEIFKKLSDLDINMKLLLNYPALLYYYDQLRKMYFNTVVVLVSYEL